MVHKKTDVLVLNRNYCPIHIICWKRAISLIFQESARSLDRDYIAYDYQDWLKFSSIYGDNYPCVGMVDGKIALPEIVILKIYDRLPTRDVKFSRQNLFERDRYTCAYCGEIFNRSDLTVDHIIPRSQGGKTIWNNVITACFECNNIKSNKTPDQARMPLLYKPKKPSWIGHIANLKPDHPCKSWNRFLGRVLVEPVIVSSLEN